MMAQGLPPADQNQSTTGVANVLPELLLGLLGHTGGAFVCVKSTDEQNNEQGVPKLSAACDWISQPEREQLDNLVRLGYFFARLEAFVDSVSEQVAGTGSIYHAALASGLEELLDVYRNAVLQVEQRLLRPPTPPPLLALRHFLSDFEVLLPEASKIVQEAQQGRLKGAQIMLLLDRRTRCGIPSVQACAGRLLWHCHRAMFKQIESWIFGTLIDPGKDFFIQNSKLESSSIIGRVRGGGSRGDDDALASLDGYFVVQDELPPAVPLSVADSILFLGKSTRILRSSKLGSSVDTDAEIAVFTGKLRDLQREESLRPAALRFAVETVQSRISGLLWDMLRQKCDLNGQLSALQAYFLLGRGDVYQQLLEDAAGLLAVPPAAATATADFAQAFSQAAITSGAAESDPFFPSFQLKWYDPAAPAASLPLWHPLRDTSLHVPSFDVWDGLCLECTAEWPIRLLLPVEVLQKYCAVWQFIFRLRRAQGELEGSWASLAALDRTNSITTATNTTGPPPHRIAHTQKRPPRALLTNLGQLRQCMAHFASNLALYLRVDVAEAAAAVLRRGIAAAKDFKEADAVHRTYVQKLTSEACLDVKQLMAAVEAIFLLGRQLCSVVKNLEAGDVSFDGAAQQVDEVGGLFRLKRNVVFQLLQSHKLMSGPRAAGLRQLVVRLNFNYFCERDVLQEAASYTAAAADLKK